MFKAPQTEGSIFRLLLLLECLLIRSIELAESVLEHYPDSEEAVGKTNYQALLVNY